MSTTQANYLKYGITDGDSKMRVSNDAPGDVAGLTAGECGKGRLMEQGQQCASDDENLNGADQTGYDNVATTVDSKYNGGSDHIMLFIINGVSYTVKVGTATDIPRICREVMDNAKDPWGNGIPYA